MAQIALYGLLAASFWWMLFVAHPYATMLGTFLLAALISKANAQ